MVAFLLPLLLLLACLLPLSDPPRLLGCVDGIVGRGALTSIGPLERALSGGVEICLDVVGRPPESALKSARRASDGSLPCLQLVSLPCLATLPTGLANTIMCGGVPNDAPVMAHKLPNPGARGFVANHDPLRTDVAILTQLLSAVLLLRHRSNEVPQKSNIQSQFARFGTEFPRVGIPPYPKLRDFVGWGRVRNIC